MLSSTSATRGKETGYPQRGLHQKDARLATLGMMYVVIQEQEKGHSGSGWSGLPTGVDKLLKIAAVCLYSAVIQ